MKRADRRARRSRVREATSVIRVACTALARVLTVVLLCLAVSKWLGEGFESASVYIATTIAVDAQIRLALLKEEGVAHELV